MRSGWPRIGSCSFPVARSQMRTKESSAAAKYLPSAERVNAQAVLTPSIFPVCRPVAASRRRIVLSALEEVTSVRPSGEKRIWETKCSSPFRGRSFASFPISIRWTVFWL